MRYWYFVELEVCDDSCDWSLSYFWMDLDIAFRSTIGTLLMCYVCALSVPCLCSLVIPNICHLRDYVISINICWVGVKI
jgi:hypothetical protein